jgi:hypothetical protein
VHSESSVQPDGLEEIVSIPTADRPPSYKELQANGMEVTSLTPLAVDPVTTVSTKHRGLEPATAQPARSRASAFVS